MNDSSSDCQLNQSEFLCDVDEQLVPKVGITFNTLEEVRKFYKNYSKFTDFSTKIWSTNKKKNEIQNQLITCIREMKIEHISN
ncbi:hypothetical protein Ahy_A07g034278 [Arachis hypogaea]|uniref:FAR1 domain-containing protein n=1 Tax=Arachis hypogaea TaxID=3818 RepID=A0A445CBE1_ARAHY|nr:hypothetical protein Ahy_A07g034278 [Arachis hypogaea]